ncbi:efflux transporter outer membrane subunit [Catenovulum sp. SM1970]|uniref:efflux transporter outer membrane subunit n=1 Tax=Marinifaba aquimaris TaxID=2741323 RepID=UPI001572A7E3|nr:efflux transporter outer membrane subunit [Marinifaba aquimaris]NTS75581.1 efflux transporter outer membrane subunit [Marinifaba aquimaris]
MFNQYLAPFRLSLLTLALTGCAVGPDYQKAESLPVSQQELPNWQLENQYFSPDASIAEQEWRSFYQDEHLQGLIEKALNKNIDLRIASERVYRAQTGLIQRDADYSPQLAMNFDADREKTSAALTSDPKVDNEFKWTGYVTWELDLWGKLRRAKDAAIADLQATQADFYAAKISLIAQVADLYYQIQDTQHQIWLTQNNITAREKSKRIAELRHKQGVISGLDVSQSNVELVQEKLKLPALHNRLNSQMYQLSILLDQSPKKLNIPSRTEISLKNKGIPVGLPSTLLKRRPDIIASERKLYAATSNIGVAKADYFPNISLIGEVGAKSLEFDTLLDNAEYWEIGADIRMPIFNWGATKANVDNKRSEYREAILNYRKSIFTAFRETAEAIENVHKNQVEFVLKKELLAATNEYLRIARLRYDNGVVSYLDVLDAQRSQAQSQQDFSAAAQALQSSYVNLYKALGGGWNAEAFNLSIEAETHVEDKPVDMAIEDDSTHLISQNQPEDLLKRQISE